MKPSYITYQQLWADCLEFSRKLRGKIDGIIAVPRSGVVPAQMIGIHLNIPVVTVPEFIRTGFVQHQGGERCRMRLPRSGRVLILDDSIFSGAAISRALMKCVEHRNLGWSYLSGAIYCTEEWVDQNQVLVHRVVPKPRYFAWNLFGHSELATTAFDFDGVLCYDPPYSPGEDAAYLAALETACPLHLPTVPIRNIVTGRLEARRVASENWLGRNGVRLLDRMIMAPFDDPDERRKYGAARWKGETYRELPCHLFIESHDESAATIAKISGKPVISVQSGTVF